MEPILLADTYLSTTDRRLNNGDYPTILILQGVEIDKAEYASISRELAGLGFNVVVPNFVAPSGDYICPDSISVAHFLSFAETALPEIKDSLKSGFILLGHSAGGMAAFNALGAKSSPLDPWPVAIITYGSSAPRLNDLQKELPPTLAISGLKDTIVPPKLTILGFENLPSRRKNFLSLLNFHHYSITDSAAPKGAPEQQAMGVPFGHYGAGILAKIISAFAICPCIGKPGWEEALDADISTEISSLIK